MRDLEINLTPSYLLAALLVFLHAGAIIILCKLSIPKIFSVGLIIICVFSLFYTLCQQVFRLGSKTIIKITHTDGTWLLTDRKQQIWPAVLKNDSIRTLPLMLLNFKLANQRTKHSIIILRDSLDADSFRRLRVSAGCAP